MKRNTNSKNINNFYNVFAFTLAEMLIVVGVIGIIAALTLPSINYNANDKENVTKLKKIYSSLSDGFERAQAVYGPADEWFSKISSTDNKDYSKQFARIMIDFVKVSKVCGFEEGCFADEPMHFGNRAGANLLNEYKAATYMVKLLNGSSLGFECWGLEKIESPSACVIRVDIDGPKRGNNQMGKDIFSFSIGFDKNAKNSYYKYLQLIPSANPEAWKGEYRETTIGNYSTAWAIQNGNFDYLYCSGLNWDNMVTCDDVFANSNKKKNKKAKR